MPLNVGARLGPYEIQAAIGAGGMGEVYKAFDTRLDRTVAIKILPEALAADPVFRERFEREAKAIAALQHPHICTLFDIGHQDNVGYLVLEYLDGQTLADRLTKGALPIDQALTYGIQIADALDKAHRAGIVHRDLKPGNVMLTKSGVKLLDFGLAKTGHGGPAGAGPVEALSALPTEPALTARGTILGTFQYMAPEQLEGHDADARTDIFAFGAVVYEMVTGKRAFEGKSQASLIHAIMGLDPIPISTAEPLSPRTLDRVVTKCLAKEPDRRWQSVGDLRDELKWIAEGGSQSGASAPVSVRKNRERLAWAVAALAVLLALSIPTVVRLREAPTAVAPEMRLEISTPSTADPLSFALSPDGRQIVFVASGDGPSRLWLRRLDGTEAQPLAGTEGASFPFWSPDSRSVGFFADAMLKRLDIGAGLPRILASFANNRGGAWSPNGTILYTATNPGPLFRIPASGGEPVAVTKLENQTNHRFPHFLADGRHFLFHALGTAETDGLYIGSLDASTATRLGTADSAGVPLHDGWVLFMRGNTVLAQRLDLEGRRLAGDPVTVADPVALDQSLFVGAFSVSATGLVAYRLGVARRQLVWFDRSGKAQGALAAPDNNGLTGAQLAPDGRRAATFRTVEGNTDIWLLDAARRTRLTSDASRDVFPVWSPDGSRLAFDSNRRGHRDLYITSANKANSEELLVESGQDKSVADWSPDGRFLLYHSIDPETSWDLWVLPMDGDRTPVAWLKTRITERSAKISPDGRWVAYISDESGQREVYVRPFSGTLSEAASEKWPVSTAGGAWPRWRADGRELYYLAPDDRLMAVPVAATGRMFEVGVPVALFRPRIYGGGTNQNVGSNYDVSDDGRFLINTVLDDEVPITILQNWDPERQR